MHISFFLNINFEQHNNGSHDEKTEVSSVQLNFNESQFQILKFIAGNLTFISSIASLIVWLVKQTKTELFIRLMTDSLGNALKCKACPVAVPKIHVFISSAFFCNVQEKLIQSWTLKTHQIWCARDYDCEFYGIP